MLILNAELGVAGVMVVAPTSTIVHGRMKMHIHDLVDAVVRPALREVVRRSAVLELTAIQMSVHGRSARKCREKTIFLPSRNTDKNLNPKPRTLLIALQQIGGTAKEEIWAPVVVVTGAEAAAKPTRYLSGAEEAGEHSKSPKSQKEPVTGATCPSPAKEKKTSTVLILLPRII